MLFNTFKLSRSFLYSFNNVLIIAYCAANSFVTDSWSSQELFIIILDVIGDLKILQKC